MNRQKLSNISLAAFRRFLFEQGCTRVEQGSKGRGGHEKWVKPGLLRPIILQTHVDPVPELIVRNCLSSLGKTGSSTNLSNSRQIIHTDLTDLTDLVIPREYPIDGQDLCEFILFQGNIP